MPAKVRFGALALGSGDKVASTIPLLDRVIFDTVGIAEANVEEHLDCDLLYYYGELRTGNFTFFRDSVERLADRAEKKLLLGCASQRLVVRQRPLSAWSK